MKGWKNIAIHIVLLVVAIVMVFPMAWMIVTSLHEQPEQYESIWELVQAPYSMLNYREALSSDSFARYFANSIVVGCVVTAGNILFCFLTGYALARRRVPGSRLVFASLLAVLIIPPQVIMIPLFRLMVELRWINSYAALVVPWLVTPFGVFLVKQYVESLPAAVEEAARLDGASEMYVLFRIVMPLCAPILTVLAIYVFLGNWNSFLYPFLFTNDEAHRTLPVGLAFYVGKQSIDWGHLMAGASISAVPVLMVFVFFQRQIIKGLTAGALKE